MFVTHQTVPMEHKLHSIRSHRFETKTFVTLNYQTSRKEPVILQANPGDWLLISMYGECIEQAQILTDTEFRKEFRPYPNDDKSNEMYSTDMCFDHRNINAITITITHWRCTSEPGSMSSGMYNRTRLDTASNTPHKNA